MRRIFRTIAVLLLAAAPVVASPGMNEQHGILSPILALFLLTLLAAAVATIAILSGRLARCRRDYDRLADAEAAAQHALRSRNEFLATTSHEIRTPLNGILGMTQVMLADNALDARVRDRIGIVHGAGEAMKALVDDMLDIAKIDAGALTVEQVPFDLRRLIDEAQRFWSAQAERKNLRLDVDLGDCPAWIEGDPVRLRQIVGNLMSNAIKFTEHGSVALSVGTAGIRGDERLLLRVADTGIGVPPPQHDLIFEKYRQADGSITRRFGGTGLGLAICRSLADAMHGTITVDSQPERGSTFTVTLPLVHAPDAAEPIRSQQHHSRASTLSEARLLVIEPNPLTRRVVIKMLEGIARRISGTALLGEAEERLTAGGIDHVVVDFDCLADEEPGCAETVVRICKMINRCDARLTILFAPGRELAVATFLATWPGAQALAKPIAVPDLIAALHLLYPERDAATSDGDLVDDALAVTATL